MSRNESWDGLGSNKTAIHDNVANEISAVTLKATPVAADEAVIEDSAASYVKKSMTLGTLPIAGDVTGTLAASAVADGADSTAIHDNVSGEFDTLSSKGTPVAADKLIIEDSAASAAKRQSTLGTIPAAGDVTGTLAATVVGDMTFGSDAEGDMALRGGVGGYARLAIGSNLTVLTSNGTTASWTAPAAGGLTYITETRETAVENLVNLVPDTAADNICLNLEGGGALMLTASDGSTQGNARGANAVDLTTGPRTATEVASGQYSGLFGGYGNTASGTGSWVGGGTNNHATTTYSIVAGGDRNNATGSSGSGCFAGVLLAASGLNSTAIGGQSLVSSNTGTATVGGLSNQATAAYAAVVGGNSNTTSGEQSFLGGGSANVITTSNFAAAIGGSQTLISASSVYSAVIGGAFSQVTKPTAVVLGGSMALADHPGAVAYSGNSAAWAAAERGKSQGQFVHMDGNTTNATPTVLKSQGAVELAVPSVTCFGITGKLVAWNETDTTLTTWLIDLDCFSTNGSSVTFLAGNGTQTIAASDDAGVPVFGITNTSGNLNFDITGIAAKTIRWSMVLHIARAAT